MCEAQKTNELNSQRGKSVGHGVCHTVGSVVGAWYLRITNEVISPVEHFAASYVFGLAKAKL